MSTAARTVNDDVGYSVAIDIGGTFTDLVAVDDRTGDVILAKQPSVPSDFLQGVRSALGNLDGQPIRQFRHGTTVGTNALIQRTGSRVGLITTDGFRDVLLAARATRPELYDAEWDPPRPLAARRHIMTVIERVDYRGEIVTPLDEETVRRAAANLVAEGVEAIAICFINAFVNGMHERRALKIVREAYPDVFVCASSVVVPEMREFERTSTTVVNAYLGKPMSNYLHRLVEVLHEFDYDRDVLVAHSGGGLMTSEPASRLPARCCQSGPAAGVMGGLAVARRVGRKNAITLDMGGTSADISVIVAGQPVLKSALYPEFNIPVLFPSIDLATIGAGGGTIAWVDSAGQPHSGPMSAGADPGPACYGIGGDRPTNTDANLVLNRLRPKSFMGGRREVKVDAARDALQRELGDRLACSAEEAAVAALRLSNAEMINAVRLMTIERGYDPRDFALVVFGGAGPLHGTDLAQELGIPEVIIPTHPGLVSAMGALQVGLRHDFVRAIFQTATNLIPAVVVAARSDIEAEIEEAKAVEADAEWTVEWRADLRYYGKVSGGLTVTMPGGPDELGTPAQLARYQEEHLREYGYVMDDNVTDIEVVNLRAALIGHVSAAELPTRSATPEAGPDEEEDAYFLAERAFLPTRFVDRNSLAPGDTLSGPAVIEEWDSTTVIAPGATATVAPHGELIIEMGTGA